jgi:hypothetical protein
MTIRERHAIDTMNTGQGLVIPCEVDVEVHMLISWIGGVKARGSCSPGHEHLLDSSVLRKQITRFELSQGLYVLCENFDNFFLFSPLSDRITVD